ncbi:MAG: cytochrome c biogenesis protein CcsA [Desulfuromonadales bacterium]|nr:cytochrome c biogenesis protein CcsA [Desulfuromonadales bacterium]
MPETKILPFIILVAYLAAASLYPLQLRWRRPGVQHVAFGLTATAFALQSLFLGYRWWLAGYLPVTNLFSTQFFFSWALAGVYLYFELRYRIGAAGLFVIFVNMLLLISVMGRDAALPPLIPALDTPLFTLHVAFSFVGYAFFAMAFSLGVLYLLQRRTGTSRLPPLAQLRRLNEEAIFLGFACFTLCMLFGSIWAQVAWGYWFSWNIKGVWSFLVWLFYSGMCHAKFVRRWQGTGYAILSIAGFGVVLFTYLGIGLLLSSNHPLE